jgi:hypothetical protein
MFKFLKLSLSNRKRIDAIEDYVYKTSTFKVKDKSIKDRRSRLNWFEVKGVSYFTVDYSERDKFLMNFKALLQSASRGIIYIRNEDKKIPVDKYLITTRDSKYYVGVPMDELYYFSAQRVSNPLDSRPKIVKVDFGKLKLSDGNYAKVFVAYRFPEILPEGFLSSTYNLVDEIFFVWFKESPASATRLIDRARIRKLEGESIRDAKELEYLEAIGDKIMGGEDLILYFLFFVVKSKEVSVLNEKSKRLVAVLKQCGIDVQELKCYHVETYLLHDWAFSFLFSLEERVMDSDSAKVFMPFITEELMDQGGILLGLSGSGKPVIFNVFTKPNLLFVILGVTGSGKSMTAKIYLRRMVEKHNLPIIGIDPESEYTRVAKYFRATPFEIVEGQRLGLDPIKLYLQYRDQKADESIFTLGQIVDFLCDLYVVPTELKGILKGELYIKVERKGSVENIIDFVESLSDEKLRKYLSGVLSPPDLYVYEGKTPTITGSTIFGMKGIRSNTTKILISALLSAYIYNRLLTKAKKSIFFVDEAWLFMKTPSILSLFENISKRGRKYGCNFLYITQRVEDVASTPEGRSILEQASNTLILKHEKESAEVLSNMFKLSPAEINMLCSAPPGVGILKTAGQKIRIRVLPDEEELSIFSTTVS